MTDPLAIAVRAFARPLTADPKRQTTRERRRARGRATEIARRPPAVLVLDCETTIDALQSLQFGGYRYQRLNWTDDGPELVCVEEGLFYTEELPTSNPVGWSCLGEYTRSHKPEIAADVEDAARGLRLRSRGEFCEQVLWAALSAQATVVGFNLPFDLSRLGFKATEARREFAGGFSLCLYGYERAGVQCANPFRPRVLIRSLDSKRSRIRLGSAIPGADPNAPARGHGAFLDLHTLAYALTGRSLSLEDACNAFGVPYRKRAVEHGQITPEYAEYCREDVAATSSLYQALAHEYERW